MKSFFVLVLCLFPILVSAHNAVDLGIRDAIVSFFFWVIAVVIPFILGIIFMILRLVKEKPKLNIGTYICFGLIIALLAMNILNVYLDVQKQLTFYGNGPAPKFLAETKQMFVMFCWIAVALVFVVVNVWKDLIDRGRKKMLQNDL